MSYIIRPDCEVCGKKMEIDIANTRTDHIEICADCLANEVPNIVVFNRPGMPVPWGTSGGGAVAYLRGKKIACTEAIWRTTARGAKCISWGRCSKQEFENNIAAYLAEN